MRSIGLFTKIFDRRMNAANYYVLFIARPPSLYHGCQLEILKCAISKKMTIRQSDALCTICSLLFTLYFYTKYINALFSNVCCVYLLNPLLNVFALFSKCFKIIKGRKKTIFVYLNFCTLFSKMKKKIIGAYLIFGDYLHTSIIS